MGFFEDIKKESRKTQRRFTLSNNKLKGKIAESSFVIGKQMQGYEVRRTGHGSDYETRKIDLLTNKKGRPTLHEIKSSKTATVSPLQKKTMKRNKGRYKLEIIGGY